MEQKNLDVWIESRELTKLVYDSTKSYPKEEIFGLTNQMRRCTVSVPSNIAEGRGRNTSKETMHFLLLQEVLFLNLKHSFIYH
ncbi:four helix bundle protein [Chryseobacterium zhengzhouense]|uniref:Four helix bundle protein n=1 Tax=Chryseobacterium zhengzhouense TaxID=1636086 RepID=A0ABW2M1W4_9FLAO